MDMKIDTSEKYILMCYNDDIQKLWVPAFGDYHIYESKSIKTPTIYVLGEEEKNGYESINVKKKTSIFLNNGEDNNFGNFHIKNYFWLPTQKQLQNILFSNRSESEINIKDILYEFYCFSRCEFAKDFTSMEQHWLGYVMYNLFSKYCWGEENIWEIISTCKNCLQV